jgi:hypothetical protein
MSVPWCGAYAVGRVAQSDSDDVCLNAGCQPDRQIDALGDQIQISIGEENLELQVWIQAIKLANQWRDPHLAERDGCRQAQGPNRAAARRARLVAGTI